MWNASYGLPQLCRRPDILFLFLWHFPEAIRAGVTCLWEYIIMRAARPLRLVGSPLLFCFSLFVSRLTRITSLLPLSDILHPFPKQVLNISSLLSAVSWQRPQRQKWREGKLEVSTLPSASAEPPRHERSVRALLVVCVDIAPTTLSSHAQINNVGV